MFKSFLVPVRAFAWALAVAAALPAAAHQQAHTHGQMTLDVAVDARSITLALASPLDSFLGFERAPRTAAERKQVADMVARLKAADQLFQPDPAGGCQLAQVALESEALGLGTQRHAQEQGGEAEHADIAMDIVFTCARAADARFIDVKLFGAYPRLRGIEAQVAVPQGQFKRSLRPGAARLGLAR